MHHPDTANPDNRKSNEKFHAISEAWSVLSKPDSRKKYDAARMRFLSAQNKAGFNTSSNSSDSAAYGESLDAAVISSIYDTQRENYSRVYAAAATSTREDLVARQQYERWQNRPLHEKKVISLSICERSVFFGRLDTNNCCFF